MILLIVLVRGCGAVSTTQDLPLVEAMQLRPDAIVDPASQAHLGGPATVASVQALLAWQHRPGWTAWSQPGLLVKSDGSM